MPAPINRIMDSSKTDYHSERGQPRVNGICGTLLLSARNGRFLKNSYGGVVRARGPKSGKNVSYDSSYPW